MQELEEQINRIYSGESQVFRELREKFESQFEEVMEKANERVNKIKEESEQNLRVKNAELE